MKFEIIYPRQRPGQRSVGGMKNHISDIEMEKEKKKFNLRSLLRIYLRKKNKSLHCHSCRPLSTSGAGAQPAPPPGSDWTVKLSQLIYYGVAASGEVTVESQKALAK